MRHPPPGLPSRRPARPQAARTGPGESLWYLDAVIYQLNVKAFFDSNDDGVGDFNGVTARLDHVKDLGVNTIWLMPFYPSPLRDDGYDISDYLDVHPHYGTLDDFRRLLDEAHRRDLRVITELVINHTSDQHPWFQRARKAPPGSPERDFYVWSDTDDRYRGTRIIFTDTETSNWTYDPVAKAYFWHRFFSHQPDLNFDNPQVLEAIFETMRFWLDMGVDGFRLDAIPYLVEREGTNNENLPETHAIIRKLRAAIDASYPNRFLLAEANQWPEDVCEYFGDGDECHAAYHFPLMPRMYMAIAQEDRFPLTEIMQQTPAIPSNCQWAIFLRNHDELTLEMVTSKERDYMYSTYAADPRARINLGIRRRLAPLMDNDTDRIKLMNSLLLSMRGSPIIYYGDEIGMGDNVFVGDRNGVRTPMQWSPDRNAGFSRADPQRLYLPPIMDAVYGYEALNVEAQQREPASLLNWMRRMLAVRATSKAFGRGELLFLRPGNRKVLAYLRTWRDDEQGQDEVILCVVNLARSAQPVELDLSAFRGRVPVEMLGRTAFPPIGDLPYLLTIAAHGFYWFRLSSDTAVPNWHQSFTPVEERPLLVLFDGWNSLFRDQVVPWRIGMAVQTRAQFENAVLPSHVAAQRWHGPKGGVPQRAEMVDDVAWTRGADTWLLPLLRLHGATAAADSVCFLPLALAWEDGDEERYRAFSSSAVARVRQQAEVGVMADAFADERFCRALAEAIGEGLSLPTRTGTLRFLPTRAHAALAGAGVRHLPVQRAQAQGRHTLVALGDRLVLKAYRQAVAGRNPEFEIGRFLTEDAGFQAIAPVAGALEHVGADGVVRTLCLLQAHVSNQGDAWTMMVGSLQRHFEDIRSRTDPLPVDVHGAHLALTETLGRRAGELHLALAHAGADAAFTPEPLLETDHEAERREVAATARDAFAALEAALGGLDDETRSKARGLLDARASVMARIDAFTAPEPARLKTRIHGDFHLAQVLVTRNDFVIVGFEGDPALPVPQRRRKHSPMRDVAAMLRSFAHVHASAQRAVAPTADEAAALARAGRAWEAATRSAFLNGYVSAAGDGVLYPPGFDPDRTQLPLFEWHRALVELSMALTDAGPHDEAGARQAAVPAALDAILGLLATRALPAPAGRKEV